MKYRGVSIQFRESILPPKVLIEFSIDGGAYQPTVAVKKKELGNARQALRTRLMQLIDKYMDQHPLEDWGSEVFS